MITSCDTTRVDIISMESIDTEKLAQAENDCQSVLRSCKKQQNSELQ